MPASAPGFFGLEHLAYARCLVHVVISLPSHGIPHLVPRSVRCPDLQIFELLLQVFLYTETVNYRNIIHTAIITLILHIYNSGITY